MIFFFNTLLSNDKVKVIPAEFGTTINPTAKSDNVTDFVVAPIMATVSTDSNIEVKVLIFFSL